MSGSPKLSVEIASSLDRAGVDSDLWDDLVASSPTGSVFQTHAWTRSWLSVFGSDCEPMIVTAANGTGPAGIVSLVLDRPATGERVMRFLGDGRADYCDFLVSGNHGVVLGAMLDAVLSQPGWDVIEFNNIPSGSPTVAAVREACGRAGLSVLSDDHFVCPTLVIRGREDCAREILRKPSLRRRERYFRRNGTLTCRHLTSHAEIEPYLDRFFKQHVSRWHGSRSPSLFNDGRNRAFYRELSRELDGSGRLLFSVIEYNNNPVAFHYGFDYADSVIWYKPSFDVEHASWSPGMVLMKTLVCYALERGRRELDFTVGDEPFKRRFANELRKTVRLLVFRNPARFILESSKRILVTTAKTLTGRSPGKCTRGTIADRPLRSSWPPLTARWT